MSQDGARELCQNITDGVTGREFAFDIKGERDDRIDVGAAYLANARVSQGGSGRAERNPVNNRRIPASARQVTIGLPVPKKNITTDKPTLTSSAVPINSDR